MKILVVGSGGREAAICKKIKESRKCTELFCAPGNAGIAGIAQIVPESSVKDVFNFAKKNAIDLTIVGPEAPLTEGIVDLFEKEGLKIFGPTKAGAQVEGSKIFSKRLMQKYNIPTAYYEEFTDAERATGSLKGQKYPVVIKADGLAAGKGVIIALDENEAKDAIRSMLLDRQFGAAGSKIIIEEYLNGEEASILCFADGKTIVPMESSQDHKRIFDGDKGPNTGGMGAYSPAPIVTKKLLDEVQRAILQPSIDGLANEGCLYKGVLYVGLMITKDGPKVLEYNARFGDPETQAVLPRLKTDLVDIALAVIDGKLDKIKIEWHKKAAVCIVLASGGYPGDYKKGYKIEGLEEASSMKDVFVYHAGTSSAGCDTVTSGGRVLGVTAMGDTIKSAIDAAYKAAGKISFEGMQFRTDIGAKAL